MERLIAGAALAAAFMLAGCAPHAVKPGSTITLSLDEAGNKAIDPDEQKVLDALKMIESGRIQLAVDGPLAEVIAKYEALHAGKSGKVFCAEGMLDALVYATAVDKAQGGKSGAPVEVIGPAWARAYWARGYAYSEMGRYADARVELEKALALSPMNSQYKSELAFAYERSRDWEKMLALYKEAQDAAAISGSPEHASDLECVALRGQGYALVELHRLDEAVKAYRDCLKLKPGEPKSLGELGYIRDLRARSH
ncbi:MAG TPA: tetratricopeptide repeat protein [Rhodanobacter sp.]